MADVQGGEQKGGKDHLWAMKNENQLLYPMRSGASFEKITSKAAFKDNNKIEPGGKSPSMSRFRAGIAIGVGLGVALGVALDNIAVGIAIGIGVGIMFGVALSRQDTATKGGE